MFSRASKLDLGTGLLLAWHLWGAYVAYLGRSGGVRGRGGLVIISGKRWVRMVK